MDYFLPLCAFHWTYFLPTVCPTPIQNIQRRIFFNDKLLSFKIILSLSRIGIHMQLARFNQYYVLNRYPK